MFGQIATALLLAAGAGSAGSSVELAEPIDTRMSLVDFIDASDGLCWVLGTDGEVVPREQLHTLRGDIDIECVVADGKADTLI